MFGNSKISKSLLDAVNSVIGTDSTQVQQLDEATSEKVPTSTGMKVYGHRYGDSKKARKDQTKHSVDDVKGPKEKEMKEELKGNQSKIDANHNGKIDAQDFKILRGKKEVKESDDCVTKPEVKKIADKEVDKHEKHMHKGKKMTFKEGSFSDRLIAMYEAKSSGTEPTFTDNNIGEKIDTKTKTVDMLKGRVKVPASYDDAIEHKSSKVKLSAEEMEHDDEKEDKALVKKMVKKTALKNEEVLDEATPAKNADIADKAYLKHKPGTVKGQLTQIGRFLRGKPEIKEENDLTEEQLDEMINEVLSKDATAGDWIHDFVHSDNPKFAGKSKAERKKMALGAYYGKKNEEVEAVEEKVIAGTSGWEKMPKEVKDKSGAVHTPMSRAKDLAKKAFKKVKNETMMGKISN